MKVDLVQQETIDFFSKKIKMSANNLIKEEDKKILNDETEIHDENFQEFHKKVFDEMLEQAIFLACKVLDREGKQPGVGDLENEFNYLTKHIMEEKN